VRKRSHASSSCCLILPADVLTDMPSHSSRRRHSSLRNRFKYITEAGVDLLGQLLAYDPDERISCEDAMKHPYFRSRPGRPWSPTACNLDSVANPFCPLLHSLARRRCQSTLPSSPRSPRSRPVTSKSTPSPAGSRPPADRLTDILRPPLIRRRKANSPSAPHPKFGFEPDQ
jgi:serine/threonine protein kinase